MGAVPTPVNKPVDTVNGIIGFTIFGLAVRAFKVYAAAQIPILRLPIISQIFDYVMDQIGTFFYTFISQWVTFGIIDLQTSAELNAYTAAEGELRKTIIGGDKDEIAKSTEKFKTAFESLIHWDGSGTTTGHG